MNKTLHIATLSLVNAQAQLLVVRKRATNAWMLPGGKAEKGESATQTVLREVREELQLNIAQEALHYLGHFSAPAANEPDHIVEAENFMAYFDGDVVPCAELEEVRWINPAAPLPETTAPLLRHHQIPALLAWMAAHPRTE
jgi:8-oxo-dGTP diphosphatase